jgi:hypothetical protein
VRRSPNCSRRTAGRGENPHGVHPEARRKLRPGGVGGGETRTGFVWPRRAQVSSTAEKPPTGRDPYGVCLAQTSSGLEHRRGRHRLRPARRYDGHRAGLGSTPAALPGGDGMLAIAAGSPRSPSRPTCHQVHRSPGPFAFAVEDTV